MSEPRSPSLVCRLPPFLANASGVVPHGEDRRCHHSEVMTNTKRTASLLIVLSSLAVPSAAFAADDLDDSSPAGDGGCFYTDEDGYDIPIFDGEGVVVDGKVVTCNDGELTISRSRTSWWSNAVAGSEVVAPTTTHRTSRAYQLSPDFRVSR